MFFRTGKRHQKDVRAALNFYLHLFFCLMRLCRFKCHAVGAFTELTERRRHGPNLSPSSGASVNTSASGDSALHIASRLSSPELLSVLLDNGADHLLLNSEGKRPLDLAPPDSLAGRLLRKAGGIQTTATK